MSAEPIVIASDHAGYDLKTCLIEELRTLGFEPVDLGANGPDSVDYPDFADSLARSMSEGRAARGIVVCGSGVGISIAANRHRHVRAALCHDGLEARLARQHNDANVLALGGRLIGVETAKDCLREFLGTEYEGGRHERRVAKLSDR